MMTELLWIKLNSFKITCQILHARLGRLEVEVGPKVGHHVVGNMAEKVPRVDVVLFTHLILAVQVMIALTVIVAAAKGN